MLTECAEWKFASSLFLFTAKLVSPNAGLQNSMSSVGVGQPSPAINTSTPIDPSSMQRAYAALGLPYSSQATGQSQQGPGQQAGAQNSQAQQQQQLQQQMRPINALGKATGKFLVLPMNMLWNCTIFVSLKKTKTVTLQYVLRATKTIIVLLNKTKLALPAFFI